MKTHEPIDSQNYPVGHGNELHVRNRNFQLNEDLAGHIFKTVTELPFSPLPVSTYAEAMERYGSDKPDTRFGLELVNVQMNKHSGFKVFSGAVKSGGIVKVPPHS